MSEKPFLKIIDDYYIKYGGDEYEVCDKGNDMSDYICKDWREH